MRISELFHLGVSQGALDFVDVDTTADVPVFIDPRAARRQQGDWGEACATLLDSHFAEVLTAIERDDRPRLHELVATGEPNETHLGWSRGTRSRGRGARGKTADEIGDAIARSAAAQQGMLMHLEDAMLLVPDVGPDLVSDQATHVLRGALIGYTQSWCEFWGIPLQQQFAGKVWHPTNLRWDEVHAKLPRTEFGPLLLVPRSIVRYHVSTDTDRYYNGFLAPLLEDREIDHRTSIVRAYGNGRHYVPRPDLHEKFPTDKPAIVGHTLDLPQALDRYRNSDAVDKQYPAMDHIELTERISAPTPDFVELWKAIEAISPGPHGAHAYHLAVVALLTAVLYPSLANGRIEAEINQGRKRIDLLYDNIATTGFFAWLTLHYPCATIPVECKNYSSDVTNPELDQLTGRFSPQRGKVGLLVSRKFDDKSLFLQRCRDSAKDDQGFVLALDDADLHELAVWAETNKGHARGARLEFPLLRARFQQLIA